jgi:hypothetical protein
MEKYMPRFRLKRDIFGDYVERDDSEAFLGCFAMLALGPVIVLSPMSVIAFLCQRIYISTDVIRYVLRFSAFVIIVCSLIGIVCLLYHWITWDDIYYFLDRINDTSKPLRNMTFVLTYSVIAWAIVFVMGLFHLFFSRLNCQWAERSGYGLLNIHCLITRKKPSVFLTTVQDTALCIAIFHFSVAGTYFQRINLIGAFLVLVLPTLMANKIFRC